MDISIAMFYGVHTLRIAKNIAFDFLLDLTFRRMTLKSLISKKAMKNSFLNK